MYGLLTSLGVQDAICKVYGNTNPFSVTQAAMKALSHCTSLEENAMITSAGKCTVKTLRDVKLC